MDYEQYTPIVLAGRFPSFEEREQWQRVRDSGRTLVVALITLLTLLFAYEALLLLQGEWSRMDVLVTLAVLIPAAVFTALFPIRYRHRQRNALQTEWYTEQADKAALEAGTVIALYPDRAVRTDLRGETVILFSQVTLCTETLHGFHLETPDSALLIRAADLTAAQLLQVRAVLHGGIARERIRTKRAAMSCLREPLPLPVWENTDRVVARAQVTLRRPWLRSVRKQRLHALLRQAVLPASVVYGVVIAESLPAHSYYPMDLLLMCAACVAAGMLLTALLSAAYGKKTPLALAFTRQGVAMLANGHSRFLVWERLRVAAYDNGIRLLLPSGGQIKIPYSRMDDPEAVRLLTADRVRH